jgi:hypothetical protein
MITKEHLKIFKSYGGDIDWWVREGKLNNTMTEAIWLEIEGILQNLAIIKNGLASYGFTTQTLHHMKISCENSEVEQELIELSKSR